jgi:hypothetical protein
MAMNDLVKRKEPEPETEKVAEKVEEKVDAKPGVEADAKPEAETPKIAVAVKPAASDEPEAKRLKSTPPDAGAVRKQVEYYLSDDNLKFDKFFHDKISADAEGWLEMSFILQCNKMKAMRATKEDVLAALKGSAVEVKEDNLHIRRPGNLALPKLENRPTHHTKKSVAHAHDGGVIAIFKDVPAEQSWMQIKEKLREKLPAKVQLWHVSEVTDKNTCNVASAPFEGDLQFFEELELEVGGVKLKSEVAHGDKLLQALKVLPKNCKEKREKEARKRQKERNRPIVVGQQRFVNVAALRTRVKEILNSRSDGESLKTEGSDYKLIKALLGFHPKGEEKSKGLVSIKVNKSAFNDNRCFWMVKDDGKEEDFSAQKCLTAIEANPPYVEVDTKKVAEAKPAEAPAVDKKEEAKPAAEAPAEEKKEEVKPAEAKPAADAPAEEKKEEAKPAEVPLPKAE